MRGLLIGAVAGVVGIGAAAGLPAFADEVIRPVEISLQPSANDADAAQPVLLQVVNPADAQRNPGTAPSGTGTGHMRSFELPAIDVVGQAKPTMRDEDRVGSYGQPRWTATRRFPGTRVYVVPEGKVELEYWARPVIDRDGNTDTRQLFEIELGLPNRFQLDLYFRTDTNGDTGPSLIGTQIEVRYALADWGKIWGNPTLYLEYVMLEQRPDKIEAKVLFGDELAPRWHWGANFIAEIELSGEKEHEWSITGGVSYTMIDSKLYLGAEAIFAATDVAGNRGHFATEFDLGPSIQWKPAPQLTINVAPLFGLTGESPAAKIFLNIGWEF